VHDRGYRVQLGTVGSEDAEELGKHGFLEIVPRCIIK
jgi:hypothetical protein